MLDVGRGEDRLALGADGATANTTVAEMAEEHTMEEGEWSY